MKKITFFNCFNNGDIHLSRGLVARIVGRFRELNSDVQFSYAHNRHPELLNDIPGLSWEPIDNSKIKSEHLGMFVSDGTLYINTWYGQQNFKYMNEHLITFDCLYYVFNDVCQKLWQNDLSSLSPCFRDFFPEIDYKQYFIHNVDKWLSTNTGKKILIANGPALSGQATNFDMMPMVNALADKYRDYSFILTERSGEQSTKNVFYSNEIIGKSYCDLNENAYISTHCDVIVGRASGVFSFSLTRQNLFERNPHFVCFSNLNTSKDASKFWLGDKLSGKIDYSCRFHTQDVSNSSVAFDIVNGLLENE